MKKYVLGVDGGGTKTHCALFDIWGNRVDMVSWGTTNHERMPDTFDGLQRELDNMISSILRKNGLEKADLGRCAFGLAGVDTKSQYTKILSILKDIGIDDPLLCNDALLGVKAGSSSGYGICLINGTGCTAIGLDSKGNVLQVGGFGSLTGDEGGGAYLGMAALSGIYNSLFKDLTHTCMADMIFEQLGVSSKDDYMEKLTQALGTGKINISELNRVVFQAANAGDRQAIAILENMGTANARSVYGIMNTLEFDPEEDLNIVFAGSIYAKGENPAAINKIKECVMVQNPNRKIKFKILKESPVLGAVVWALEPESRQMDFYEKIMNQF